MERWVLFALMSMTFAGLTSVIAKHGLTGISGDLGLAVRTCFVFVFVIGFTAVVVPCAEVKLVTWHNVIWLGVSAVTTTASWVCYYKALKDGDVSTVVLIDKGSFVVAVVFAWLLLGEKITFRVVCGGLFILAGVLIVARK